MDLICPMIVAAPFVVIGLMAYQARKAAEARTAAELEAARHGLTLPAKSSAVGKVAGAVLKAAVETAIKKGLPRPPL